MREDYGCSLQSHTLSKRSVKRLAGLGCCRAGDGVGASLLPSGDGFWKHLSPMIHLTFAASEPWEWWGPNANSST